MADLAREGSKQPAVRTLALALTSANLQKDYRGEACSIIEYVRDKIRYVRDIKTVEALQSPELTILLGAGDCDDKSTLTAALLASLGHTCRFIAVSFVPNQYAHVWTQVKLKNAWLDLEGTEPLQCGERIPHEGALAYIYQDA